MKAGMRWDESSAPASRAVRRLVACGWTEFGGARMFNVTAIKPAYPGPRRAGPAVLAAKLPVRIRSRRFVGGGDDDRGPGPSVDVMWAMCTRATRGRRQSTHPPHMVGPARPILDKASSTTRAPERRLPCPRGRRISAGCGAGKTGAECAARWRAKFADVAGEG